ncbi:cell envelope integrity protein TolA [Pedobacter sp.]|uniref:cell envelope integrity protein TolA n=1 Tax=Pedobacter sp. TaxID=1411316 RepID=UPI0031D1CFBE
MKSFIQKGLILMLFCIATETIAQVKKTASPAKTTKKNTAPAVTKSIAIELLRANAEQASRLVSNELKAMGVQIESIDEDLVYDTPKNGEKRGKLLETRTMLKCSHKIQVDVLANPNDQVQAVNWYLNDVPKEGFLAIEKILGYKKWQALGSNLYLNNNLIAEVEEMGSTGDDETKLTYSINLSKTEYFVLPIRTKVFNTDSLTVHHNPEEAGQSVVQFLNGLGMKFLYKTLNTIIPNYESKGISNVYGYTTTYMFEEGTSVAVTCNKYQQLAGIFFQFTDPLVHNKIKKWFKLSNWNDEGEGNNEGDVVYSKNNLKCVNNDIDKDIRVTITPYVTDIATRFHNTSPIDATSLVSFYLNMEKPFLKKFLTENYVTLVNVNWPGRNMTYNASAYPYDFYFKSPADSLCYVSYEYQLSDTWSRIIYFSTGDKAYYEEMKTNLLKNAEDPKSKVIVNYSDKQFEKSRMYYITIFSKEKDIENKRKKQEALVAQQLREKAEAEEKARLKAQKDAQTSADIQKVGDILIQGLQQINRRKGSN